MNLKISKFQSELFQIWTDAPEIHNQITSAEFAQLFYKSDENGIPVFPEIPDHPAMTNDLYMKAANAFSQSFNP